LPASFLTQFPQGVEIGFETIPVIPSLEQPLKDAVLNAFGTALKVVWQLVLGVAIAGSLCSIGMKQLQLHTKIDNDWGRDELAVINHMWSRAPQREQQQQTDIEKRDQGDN
jgi:hypothetical protein